MPPTSSELTRKQSLAVGVWTGLTLVAVLLWSRRLVGTFHGPMPTGWVMAWTAFVIGTSTAAERLFPSARSWLIALTVALFASLAGVPGMTAGSLGVYLGLWCLGGLILWADAEGESLWTPWLSAPSIEYPPIAESPLPRPMLDQDAGSDVADGEDALQTMSRRITDDGEVIEGSIRVTLAAGERDATVHISFCPPLPTTPTVELEDVDGNGWDLKIAAVYPFGLRLQVRRGRDCAEDVTGRIAYWAVAATSFRAA